MTQPVHITPVESWCHPSLLDLVRKAGKGVDSELQEDDDDARLQTEATKLTVPSIIQDEEAAATALMELQASPSNKGWWEGWWVPPTQYKRALLCCLLGRIGVTVRMRPVLAQSRGKLAPPMVYSVFSIPSGYIFVWDHHQPHKLNCMFHGLPVGGGIRLLPASKVESQLG